MPPGSSSDPSEAGEYRRQIMLLTPSSAARRKESETPLDPFSMLAQSAGQGCDPDFPGEASESGADFGWRLIIGAGRHSAWPTAYGLAEGLYRHAFFRTMRHLPYGRGGADARV